MKVYCITFIVLLIGRHLQLPDLITQLQYIQNATFWFLVAVLIQFFSTTSMCWTWRRYIFCDIVLYWDGLSWFFLFCSIWCQYILRCSSLLSAWFSFRMSMLKGLGHVLLWNLWTFWLMIYDFTRCNGPNRKFRVIWWLLGRVMLVLQLMKTGTWLVAEIIKVVRKTWWFTFTLAFLAILLASMNDLLFFVAGSPETLVLNMSKLVLSVLTSVKGRDPLASEVSTMCLHWFFLSLFFGGHNQCTKSNNGNKLYPWPFIKLKVMFPIKY